MSVKVDGADLSGQTLDGETMVYCGGPLPNLAQAHFKDTLWKFEGAAWNTLTLLALLDTGDSSFMEKVMEDFKSRVPRGAWTYGDRPKH